LGTFWSFATTVFIIGTVIVFRKPLGNILTNIIIKASQVPAPAPQTQPQQQQPYAGPTNNPNPSTPPAGTAAPPPPLTPSPAVAKGGNDMFGVRNQTTYHIYVITNQLESYIYYKSGNFIWQYSNLFAIFS
jgi:hypothetical protein